jgi:hypothetical protein
MNCIGSWERAARTIRLRRRRAAKPATRPLAQNARLMPRCARESCPIKTHPFPDFAHRLPRSTRQRAAPAANASSTWSGVPRLNGPLSNRHELLLDRFGEHLLIAASPARQLHCDATCSTVGGLKPLWR